MPTSTSKCFHLHVHQSGSNKQGNATMPTSTSKCLNLRVHRSGEQGDANMLTFTSKTLPPAHTSLSVVHNVGDQDDAEDAREDPHERVQALLCCARHALHGKLLVHKHDDGPA